MKVRYVLVLSTLVTAAACEVRPDTGAVTAAAAERHGWDPAQRTVADSILPMDTMIARFQSGLPVRSALRVDAPRSMEQLIGRFATAVEDSSALELLAITLDETEFAYLYFPTSIYARPPYSQPPAVNWLLMQQNSLKGMSRLLGAYGGRSLPVEGHRCAGEPVVEGRNRIHERCVLRIRGLDGRLQEGRLFGSILERDGAFLLMSLANDL